MGLNMNNLYENLGLTKNASADQIKAAYKNLANIYHPDKNGDDVMFKEINHAYRILKDPESKKRYDEFGDESKPVNHKQTVRAELAKMFQAVVKSNISNLKYKNIVEGVKANISVILITTDNKIVLVHKHIDYLDDAIGRVSPDDSILINVLKDEIKAIRSSLVQLNNTKELLILMKEEVKDYKYNAEITLPTTPATNTFKYITTGP